MAAREISKIVQDPEAMALELWAQMEVLNDTLKELAAGIQAARAAGAIFQTLEAMMSEFDKELNRLAKSVEGITGVVPSVVATLGDLAGKFKANANDPARIGQLADALDAAKTTLANGVAASTAAASEAPPAPAETPATPTETPTEPATPADPPADPPTT